MKSKFFILPKFQLTPVRLLLFALLFLALQFAAASAPFPLKPPPPHQNRAGSPGSLAFDR